MDYTFADKLSELRRQNGYSQEALADLLGVSRQAVGKWESGGALPDIPKLVAIADLFGVTLDELLRGQQTTGQASSTYAPPVATGAAHHTYMPENERALLYSMMGYEYKSRRTLFGLPLVHICVSRFGNPRAARGIIAIGNRAVGVLALGGLSAGLFSFGGVSFGLLFSLAGVSSGGLAAGGLSLGLFAVGGVAIGLYALGAVALGYYMAAGSVALSQYLAAGVVASGRIAFGPEAQGAFTFEIPSGLSHETFWQLLRTEVPRAARLFGNLLYRLVA